MTWSSRTEIVTMGGLDVRLSIQGPPRGHPLLLINGIGAPLERWASFRRNLDLETIAFDAPGTGGSETPRWPRTMWGLARSVNVLLDRMGYGTVDVLGISWGGGLAQHLAMVRRSRVRRLILASTAFGLGSIPASPRVALNLLRPTRYLSPSHVARVRREVSGHGIVLGPEVLRHQADPRPHRLHFARGYVYQLLAAGTWVSLPWLPLVQAETLVLLAADDRLVHVVNGRILSKLIPNARLRIVPGVGHLFVFDQPEQAAAIVRDFIGTND